MHCTDMQRSTMQFDHSTMMPVQYAFMQFVHNTTMQLDMQLSRNTTVPVRLRIGAALNTA